MEHVSNFGYNRTHKRFVVEASSILDGGKNRLFEPIHDNGGTDEGLCVRLGSAEELAKFQVSGIVSVNKTIQNWTLIPTRDTVMRFPHLEGHIVVLLNS